MNIISWNCNDDENNDEIQNEINRIKEKVNKYKELLDNNQISEKMYNSGFCEVEHELFDYMKKVSEVDSTVYFCPECNKFKENYIEIDEPSFENFEYAGTRLEKRKGRYGEFMGCTRYPDCTCTRSIINNKVIMKKSILKKRELVDFFDEIDDYGSAFDYGDHY